MANTNKYNWLAILAAAATIGATVTYVLGRIYIDAYYKCYFIPSGSIAFSVQDYMFFCIPVTMMTIGTMAGIGIIYWSLKNNLPLVEPSDFRTKKRYFAIALFIFICFSATLFIALYLKWPSASPAFEGLMLGFAIGIIVNPIVWFLLFYWSWIQKEPILVNDDMAKIIVFMLVIYYFASLSFFASNLAERAAKYDYIKSPVVAITSEQLPPELELITTANNTVNAKILLINDGWIYFSIAKQKLNKTVPSFDPIANHVLYSMRLSDVQYFSQGVSENITILNQ